MNTSKNVAMTITGLLAAIVVAVLFSPLASRAPDGLEKVAEDHEFSDQAQGVPPEGAAFVMRDYTFFGIQGPWGKAAAGFAGTVLTFGAAYLLAHALRRRETKDAASHPQGGPTRPWQA